MVSIRKKRQSTGKLFSHLDDFDQDIATGNTITGRQEHATVNDGTVDQGFTGFSDRNPAVNENLVKVITLESCFKEWIDMERANFIDTVESRIQNTNLTAINSIVPLEIHKTIRSINASFR